MSAISVLLAPRDEALGNRIADALSRNGHEARVVRTDTDRGDLDLAADDDLGGDASIVIWSRAAAKLARLHEQAREALESGSLIPVAVGRGAAPKGFETVQPVDLSGWQGDDGDPRWRFVLQEIELLQQRRQVVDNNVWAPPLQQSLDLPQPENAASVEEDAPADQRQDSLPLHPASPDPALRAPSRPRTKKPKEDVVQGALWTDDEANDPEPAAQQPVSVISAPAGEDVQPAKVEVPAPQAAPRRVKPKPARRFDPTAVAVAGVMVLSVVSGAAIILAPSFPLRQAPADEAPTLNEPVDLALLQPVAPAGTDFDLDRIAPPTDEVVEIETDAPALFDNNDQAVLTADAYLQTDDAAALPEAVEIQQESATPAEGGVKLSPEGTLEKAGAVEAGVADAGQGNASADLFAGAAFAPGAPLKEEAPAEREAPAQNSAETENGAPSSGAIAAGAGETAAPPSSLEELIARVEAETTPVSAPIVMVQPEYDGDFFKDCSACPDMRTLRGGAFLMGASENDPLRRPEEGPQVLVEIGRSFAISTREVTYEQWDACVADGGCAGYAPDSFGWGRGQTPIAAVSFEDAQNYAQWLSQKTGERYRLPTEAEWEFAARGGLAGPYGFDGGLSPQKANYNARFGARGQNAVYVGRPTPVARYLPNRFGLFDMHGNVWEWTADCWRPTHQARPVDESAVGGDCATRVLKGGAWNTGGWRLRAAHRIGKAQNAREFDNGFRVVRDVN
ncbi:MAG: SUMF1/EgtB/PvdO family nonheme iron enzyme [Pseudomonadota bacterium]